MWGSLYLTYNSNDIFIIVILYSIYIDWMFSYTFIIYVYIIYVIFFILDKLTFIFDLLYLNTRIISNILNDSIFLLWFWIFITLNLIVIIVF